MKHVIDPSKQKFVIAALAVGATALGLAAASRAIFAYQIGEFLKISLYVYIFLVVLENLVFDLHLRPVRTVGALERSFFAAIRERFHYMGERRHFLHFQNYLVLPSIIYWATVALLFLSPFENTIKQILILASTLALGISFWYLKTVFYAHHEASRGKRDQPEVQRFEYHLEERLWELKRELEAESYQWGGYRAFWIYDPKRRLIKAAPFRDRIVHHALYEVIAAIVERAYIPDTYACLRGRGTLAAVRRYEEYVRRQRGRGYVLKADIKHYFPSVDHAVLRGLIRRKIAEARLLRLACSMRAL